MWSIEEVKKLGRQNFTVLSCVCIRQSLLTLSICQLPGSDFPLPKMHMCISHVVSYGCVHVKNKEPLYFIQSVLSLRDTVSVHPNMLLKTESFSDFLYVATIHQSALLRSLRWSLIYLWHYLQRLCLEVETSNRKWVWQENSSICSMLILVRQAKQKWGENLWLNNKILDLFTAVTHNSALPIHPNPEVDLNWKCTVNLEAFQCGYRINCNSLSQYNDPWFNTTDNLCNVFTVKSVKRFSKNKCLKIK